MIARLSKRMASFFARNNVIKSEDEEVYEYGLQLLLSTVFNLNLNNVVIIADSIVLDCPNVNANYSTNAAEFVGTVSEPLDIPVDEWQYMTNENGNGLPDFIENTRNWSKLIDTDGDKLPDCIEQYIGSDAMLPDTDGDGLDDCYEAFVLYTSPTKTDTDENGVNDGDEDFDEDGLTNLEEFLNKRLFNTKLWLRINFTIRYAFVSCIV